MTVTYSRVAVGTPARRAGAAEREPRVPAAACGAHAGTRDTTRAEAAASLPFCRPRSVNEWYQLRSHCGVGSARAAAVSARATRAEHDFPAVGLHQHVAGVGCTCRRRLPPTPRRRFAPPQPRSRTLVARRAGRSGRLRAKPRRCRARHSRRSVAAALLIASGQRSRKLACDFCQIPEGGARSRLCPGGIP